MRLRRAPPAEEEQPPLAVAEEAIGDANEVADKIDHAATLFTKVATGEIDIATIAGELDRLFALLVRLDRAERYKEALRLARVLARLLALATRLVALVATLKIAFHAAEALADSRALAWVLHERGTLALAAGDPEGAERDLGEARRRRERDADVAELAATERNLRYAARARLLASRTMRVGGGALALSVVLALVVVAVAGDDGPTPTPTPTSTPTPTGTETAQPTPGDDTAPSPTLATDELTNERAPALSGTAGTEEGDSQDVTVRIYEGAEVTGDPLQEHPAKRDDDGSFEVLAAPLTSGTYTAQAEQGDEAGNTGHSDAVTFSVDLEPPAVTITEPGNRATTDESPQFTGNAGQADGDEPVVRLTVASNTQSIDVQPDGTWSLEVDVQGVQNPDTLEYTPFTATADQSDEAGNVGSASVTFTPGPSVE